jgi:acetyltransferase-like isoleucine patch superfamily enzyme
MSRTSEAPSPRGTPRNKSSALGFGRSLVDPRAWFQLFRLVHYYNYNHVRPRRMADIGAGVRMAPNVSLRNGERIKIGAYSHIGAHCSIWAGDSVGRITLGRHALLGPEVFITASNYQTEPGTPVMDQPKLERDVIIGDDVWLGARVMVVPGVEIGDGCIIGASSVVTRSIPGGSIAVGNPARIVGRRGDPKAEAAIREADAPLSASGVR